MNPIINTINNFKNYSIAVIGDVMLDHYINGKVDRISPEAPVAVVSVNDFDDRAGGAANVALNIIALGAKCSLFSIVGNDSYGKKLTTVCKSKKINIDGLIQSKKRITTLKARVIGNNHQLIRFDYETTLDITTDEEKLMIAKFELALKKSKFDAVILEDYNKGVLTKNVIKKIIEVCNKSGIPTLVDPKKNNFFEYKNCTLFKPNLKEIKDSLHEVSIKSDAANLLHASSQLKLKLKNTISVITLAEKGVFYHEGKTSKIIAAHERKIADVSGAGDTVIALLALGLASKLNTEDAVKLSNLAGGLVCEIPGVVSVNKNKLIEEATKI
jgi:rfaE bifunctional protein kinase chain/domain